MKQGVSLIGGDSVVSGSAVNGRVELLEGRSSGWIQLILEGDNYSHAF